MTRYHLSRNLLLGLVISVAIAILVSIATLIQSAAARQLDRPTAPIASASPALINYPNCRFGVGGTISPYAVSALNFGWYMDWGAQPNPARPNGAEYVQMVNLKSNLDGLSFEPSTSTLLSILNSNPGATWLIGNEPDSPWQNNLLPVGYARLYHQVYYLIKQFDPSAQIGIGGIVQATPLRVQYLESMLTAYRQLYGELPPADLWNIHSYILREIDLSDPEATPQQPPSEPPYYVWGAYIPTGLTATRGELYSFSKMFDLNIFQQRLKDFRAWMNKWGYRNKPLYITEYGTLFPYPPYVTDPWIDEYGVPLTEARTATFMTGTFNILSSLSDTATGYPADANRLVQRWLWYSVSDPVYGGPLFDPTSHTRRPLGDAFAAYTQAISPSVDLLAVKLAADAVLIGAGGTATATLRATISNIGNISVSQPITMSFYSGVPPAGTLIASAVVTDRLAGCATTSDIAATWPELTAGVHPFYVQIDPAGTITEADESNNRLLGAVLVAKYQRSLPLISR